MQYAIPRIFTMTYFFRRNMQNHFNSQWFVWYAINWPKFVTFYVCYMVDILSVLLELIKQHLL